MATNQYRSPRSIFPYARQPTKTDSRHARADPQHSRHSRGRTASPRPEMQLSPSSHRLCSAGAVDAGAAEHPPARYGAPHAIGTASSHDISPREYPHAPPPASHRILARSIAEQQQTSLSSTQSSASQRTSNVQYSPTRKHFQSSARCYDNSKPNDHYRPPPGPHSLRPTAARAPRSFRYILDPVTNEQHVFALGPSNLPGTCPTETNLPPPPQYQRRENSYREISHTFLDIVLSDPVYWTDGYTLRDSSPQYLVEPREIYTQPFVYEVGRRYVPPVEEETGRMEELDER